MRGFIQGAIHSCTIFTGKEPFMVRVGFFCLLIDGKCLQNVLQIEKSKNTAFVCMESLLQMSCLHILKLKINTPLHIKKEYFTASVVKRLWISSLAAGLE